MRLLPGQTQLAFKAALHQSAPDTENASANKCLVSTQDARADIKGW